MLLLLLHLVLDIKLDVTTIANRTESELVPEYTHELVKRKNNIHHTNAQPEAKSLARYSQAFLIINGVLPLRMEQREI
jgi:hypothetical protein